MTNTDMPSPTIDVKKQALPSEQADVIRATLPAVGAAIGDITPNFYNRMFTAHPDLLANTFNRGNQKQGAQQKALAASVATFATVLVDPDAPTPEQLLSRIGHKHLSVGVVEGQYAVVHKHLFDAIEEVLTPEVFSGAVRDAWDAVYLEMQRVLVDFEKDLYAQNDLTPGDVFRTVEVTAREERGGNIAVFTVRGKDSELPEFRPGQYISVRRTMEDGAGQLRQYSLINASGHGELSFAARRVDSVDGEPAGEVSNSLWEGLQVGDDLEISLPAGDLTLDTDSDDPVVLISAGIGATPMIGMLAYLAENSSEREILELHANRSADADVFAAERAEYLAALPNSSSVLWYEPEFMDLNGGNGEKVEFPENARFYICGNNPFLLHVRAQLAERGIDNGRVHYELFSPNDWLVDQ